MQGNFFHHKFVSFVSFGYISRKTLIMELINFAAWIEQQKVLTSTDVDTTTDQFIIGKKVNDKRDGSQYQAFAINATELAKIFAPPVSTEKVYKALLTQTGTSDPSVTILANTLSSAPTVHREDVGIYSITLAGEFPALKTYIGGFLITATSRTVLIPVYKPSGGGNITIDGYYTIYRYDDDIIYLETYDETGIALVEFSTLFNGSTLALPTIEVYP